MNTCKCCNKRIWFWQGKLKRIEPIDVSEDILRHRVAYYHDTCKQEAIKHWDDQSFNDLIKYGQAAVSYEFNDGKAEKYHVCIKDLLNYPVLGLVRIKPHE